MYDEIFLFIKLAECGNYTKVAKALKIMQSTLTKRIQHLEQQLNLALIDHSTRKFTLTEAGALLYNKFSHIANNFDNLLAEMGQIRPSTVSGTLRVAIPYQASHFIIPHLPTFINQHPNAILNITYISTSSKVNLVSNNLDLAISNVIPESQNVKIKLLRKYQLKCFASAKYVARYGRPTTLEELAKHKLIGVLPNGERLSYQVLNLENGEKTNYDYTSNLNFNNTLPSIEAARDGEFIIITADYLLTEELLSGEFVELLPNYVFKEVSTYLIRGYGEQSRLEKEFAKFIEQCFELASAN